MKGQISAEMLIILAIVIAVAVVLASQLMKTSKTMGQSIEESSSIISHQTESLRVGMYCTDTQDCCANISNCNLECKNNACDWK